MPRAEAVLLILLLFLGFNVAWLLLFDQARPSRDRADTASGDRAAVAAGLSSDEVPPPAPKRPPSPQPQAH